MSTAKQGGEWVEWPKGSGGMYRNGTHNCSHCIQIQEGAIEGLGGPMDGFIVGKGWQEAEMGGEAGESWARGMGG